MATYRQVHTSFWQDGFILSLPYEEKYFYLYLMTNSKTTQCGIYELPLKVVEMETSFSADKVFDLIQRFIRYKRILYNEETREIMLLNWMKHNQIKSKAVMTCIAKELKNVKYQPFVDRFVTICEEINYPLETVYRPSKDHLRTVGGDSGEEQEEEKEKEKEKEEEQEASAHPLPNPFQDDLRNRIYQFAQKCNLKNLNIITMDDILDFIPKMDVELIEEALKRSVNKHINFAIAILRDWEAEGKTKLDDLRPARKGNPVVTSQRPKLEIIKDKPANPLSADRLEEIRRIARELDGGGKAVNES